MDGLRTRSPAQHCYAAEQIRLERRFKHYIRWEHQIAHIDIGMICLFDAEQERPTVDRHRGRVFLELGMIFQLAPGHWQAQFDLAAFLP